MSIKLSLNLRTVVKVALYKLDYLSRAQIEWRVIGLPTYLVHSSHEKLNSLCLYKGLKILL